MSEATGKCPNMRLREERLRHRWSQQDVADRIGTTPNNVSRWELGLTTPGPYFRSKLCTLFGKPLSDLGWGMDEDALSTQPAAGSPYSLIWMVPFRRNPFFTGREDALTRLHETLHAGKMAALTQLQAISGLGGIGKTQTAIEYAYRYCEDYQAILWTSAETRDVLMLDVAALARVLQLPEQHEESQLHLLEAVKRWFKEQTRWLLILDNVEDMTIVNEMLPAVHRGHVLLTTRLQVTGTLAQRFDLEAMGQEEGALFLLRRAKHIAPDALLEDVSLRDREHAREISRIMGGLPLALDQAGAYIEATQCSLSDYWQLFQSSQFRLLDERETYTDHPLSVTKTFVLAFEQLKRSHTLAIEVLTVCAFLAPEAIPETVFLQGALFFGPAFEALAADPLQFNATLKVLLTYSLLQRNAAMQTMTIHRLVQAVLRGYIAEADQRTWVTRVLHAMTHLFPSGQQMQADYWQVCERLLPHALVCIRLSEQWSNDEAVFIALISHVAIYLSRRARYAEAEPLFQRALHIGEQASMAEVCRGLADLYFQQGKYEEAESLYQRALLIEEQTVGSEHPQVAAALQGLADLYFQQGKYEEAEPLYQRALRLRELGQGPEHAQVANPLNNLGLLYHVQGKYQQAEPLFQRALRILEQAFGLDHPYVAYPLDSLAVLYFQQGKDEEAEPLFLRALGIREQVLGRKHPTLAHPLTNLADLYRSQGKFEEAEPLYLRALQIQEQILGTTHPSVASPLQGLADLSFQRGKDEEAEHLNRRALRIREQALGAEHPEVASSLIGLADLALKHGNYQEAECLHQRALAIRQKNLGPQHPHVAESLHSLAHLYEVQRQTVEALSLYRQALMLREQALGPQHPKTRTTRTAYTHLLWELERGDEADALENQISEKRE